MARNGYDTTGVPTKHATNKPRPTWRTDASPPRFGQSGEQSAPDPPSDVVATAVAQGERDQAPQG